MGKLGALYTVYVLFGCLGLLHAQTPCSSINCAENEYCKEQANGTATCKACDTSCTSCYGEGPTSCSGCTVGYYLASATLGCQVCLEGFFGENCKGVCNCLNGACNNIDGACDDWKCKRGYTGIPYCQEICPEGTFGLDCGYECHCPENDTCDNVNGDCSSATCAPNYGGAACQRKFPRLAEPPEILSVRCNNITLRWDAFNEEDNIGDGPVYAYNVEVHLNSTNAGWDKVGELRHVEGTSVYTFSVLGQGGTSPNNVLEDDEDYNFRVTVIGDNYGKPMSDEYTLGRETDVVNNLCTILTTPEPTPPPVSRQVFETLSITPVDTTTMRVAWTVLSEYARYEYDVNITVQLLGNGDCDQEGSDAQNFGPYAITAQPLNFSVQTWSRYSFTINAQAKTVDVSEIREEVVVSPAVAPTTSVSDLAVSQITANSAFFTWSEMPCNQRKGFTETYDMDITSGGTSTEYTGLTDNQRTFVDLAAYTDHNVRVRCTNEVGSGPYNSLTFKTLQGVPTAVEVASTTATSTTITVTFDPPVQINGELISYTVSVSTTSDFNETESRTEKATAGLRFIIVSRLQPETLYYLRVAASTEAGIGQYGSVVTRQTEVAPPPADDIALSLKAQTTDSITVEWSPPQNRAGDIDSYELEMKLATVDETSPLISSTHASSVREYTQTGLFPSSLYIVTITGLDIGRSVVSSVTDILSTAHGTPPEPTAPQFARSTYTNVTIRLEPVVSEYVPVTAYRVHVLLLTDSNRDQSFETEPGYIAAELDESLIRSTIEFVVGDGLSYGGFTNQPLESNSYYRFYYVVMSTVNNDTTSSYNNLTLDLPTVPYDPENAPSFRLTLSEQTTDSLTFTWDAPEGIGSLVASYDFTITEDESSSSTITTSVAPTARQYKQDNLSPYTYYSVRISAVGADGQILATDSPTFRTMHTDPPAPSPPVFADSTYTTLTVTLEPVVVTTAPLTAYQLHVEEVDAQSSSERRKRSALIGGYFSLYEYKQSGQAVRRSGDFQFSDWNNENTENAEFLWSKGNKGDEGNAIFYQKMKRTKRASGVPGEVTAQLTQADVSRTTVFVVGDGKTYGGYVNKQLSRERWYVIHYVVLSTSSNVTKMSYSSLSPAAQTVPYIPPTTVTPAPQGGDSDDDLGILIGVIVGLVLLLLILLLIFLLYLWWRRRNRFNPYELSEDDDIKFPEEPLDDYDPLKYWSAAFTFKDGRHIIVGRDLVFGESPAPPEKDGGATQGPRLTFKDEFKALPHKSTKATDNAARRQNSSLNRFPHLLPYDHSLVQLKPDATSRGSYINASFMPGYNRTPAYIAAQSPYNEETVLDFWRLIYQRSIKSVVMITNIVEDHIVKCTQYWPTQEKASFGDRIFLHLIEIIEYADYIIRTIGVKMKGDSITKVVRLFEFTSWPDHGVPDDPIPFLEMRYKVRRYQNDDKVPILVHCGTGMARTGVFIAVDTLIDQYAAEGRVMVYDFVRRMRKDRPFMVRTLKQYTFIYEAIFEEFHAGDTLIDFDLKNRYHEWTQKNSRTGRTYLRDQYKLLEDYTREPRRDQCKAAQLQVNVHKNRYLDVLPADKDRPMLTSSGAGPQATDYINAIFVDGYLRKRQFIVTQTPLHTTILDFWRLVWDYDVRTIVMVENFKHEDDTRAEYWPPAASGGVMKQLEPFFLETTACYQQENITVRSLRLLSTKHPRESARFVRQFQFNGWPEHTLAPPSKTMMLDLVDSVFDWQEEACSNERPVLVHCQDGSSHSGLFTSLAVVCERMEEDGEVDVHRTIKHIKRRRRQIIADYEQFRFCYKAVWDFMNLRMTGGTFTDTLGQSKQDKMYGVASLNLSTYMDKLHDLGGSEA